MHRTTKLELSFWDDCESSQLPEDVGALKRMIVAMAQDAVHALTVIEKLRFELSRLKRGRFGSSSEKIDGRIERLELAIEALETDQAEHLIPVHLEIDTRPFAAAD